MKAAVVHDFTKPLNFEDVPKPEPGPGEVLVKVETAGLCHTDIHAAHGDWPVKPTLPFIPGSRRCRDRRAGRTRRQHAAGGRPGRHAVAR